MGGLFHVGGNYDTRNKKPCTAATVQGITNEVSKLQNKCIMFARNCKDTYEVSPGYFCPVMGVAKHGDTVVPIVDIPMGPDYKWQLICLKSRLAHPELYAEIDGDVTETIGRLLEWLREHAAQATAGELKELYEIVHSIK